MPVTLSGVGHTWNDRNPLFSDLSWTLRRGVVTALVGPSGSGKSTLLALMAGMLEPVYGTADRTPGLRSVWVFQNPHGVARRTALDHVVLPFLAHGASRAEAISGAMTLLHSFGIADRASHRFSELSGGEAQRLMLARGIAAKPDVMLVDEPTAQLDRATADEVNLSIGELAARGTAVVVATHDAGTRAACDEVLDLALFRPSRRGGS